MSLKRGREDITKWWRLLVIRKGTDYQPPHPSHSKLPRFEIFEIKMLPHPFDIIWKKNLWFETMNHTISREPVDKIYTFWPNFVKFRYGKLQLLFCERKARTIVCQPVILNTEWYSCIAIVGNIVTHTHTHTRVYNIHTSK